MNIQLVSDLAAFRELRPAWEGLAGDCPTQSWEWASAWWSEFGLGNELQITVCTDSNGEIVAIAPFFLQRGWPLKCIKLLGAGKVCSDYSGILVHPAASPDLFAAIAKALHGRCAATVNRLPPRAIELDGISRDAEWGKRFRVEMLANGFLERQIFLENGWRLALPKTWEEYLASLSQSQRRKCRKALRRIESGELSFRTVREPDEMIAAIFTLETLHQARQGAKGESNCFEDVRFAKFLRNFVELSRNTSKVQLQICDFDNRPISIQIQLVGRDGLYFYQSGYDPEVQHLEPGHILNASAIYSAIENGFQYYDFMRGDELYKASWGARPIALLRTSYIPRHSTARLVDSATQKLNFAKLTGKHWLGRQTPVSGETKTTTTDPTPARTNCE